MDTSASWWKENPKGTLVASSTSYKHGGYYNVGSGWSAQEDWMWWLKLWYLTLRSCHSGMWLPQVKLPKTPPWLRWTYAAWHPRLLTPPQHQPLFPQLNPSPLSPKPLTSIFRGLLNSYSGPPLQLQCLSPSRVPPRGSCHLQPWVLHPPQSKTPTQIGGSGLSHAWADGHFLTGATMHSHTWWHAHLCPNQSVTIPASCVKKSDCGQHCLHPMVWDPL